MLVVKYHVCQIRLPIFYLSVRFSEGKFLYHVIFGQSIHDLRSMDVVQCMGIGIEQRQYQLSLAQLLAATRTFATV